MKSILDRSFRYTPSFGTDLRKTFARVRRNSRIEAERSERVLEPLHANISSIVKKVAAAK
jgi:hypothetical protein